MVNKLHIESKDGVHTLCGRHIKDLPGTKDISRENVCIVCEKIQLGIWGLPWQLCD